jgi:hypothetical protein
MLNCGQLLLHWWLFWWLMLWWLLLLLWWLLLWLLLWCWGRDCRNNSLEKCLLASLSCIRQDTMARISDKQCRVCTTTSAVLGSMFGTDSSYFLSSFFIDVVVPSFCFQASWKLVGGVLLSLLIMPQVLTAYTFQSQNLWHSNGMPVSLK